MQNQDQDKRVSGEWTVEEALREAGFKEFDSPVSLFRLLGLLKTTKRAGWKRFGIDAESVADHSFRMATMALFCGAEGIDVNKCMKLCLVHDFAEAVVGDFTPYSGVPREEKYRRESLTIDYMASKWNGEIKTLWDEFEAGETPEAQLAQDLDKVELMTQALDYEDRDPGQPDLTEFFGVVRKIKTPLGRSLAERIIEERREVLRKKGRGEAKLTEEMYKKQDEYYGA
ncbi:hypothetical protein B0I35DRAFT_418926 [Stachybotrys elegans]|uniref:5'-deoxynucleotidase n=1 Tax=Stachybotrys elegans TaxID=80388 RepID=A0A8K0T884_9HYPO|nr:hypothetical protein B0I35DRAFT_418926 [Stachybotrys elegans]